MHSLIRKFYVEILNTAIFSALKCEIWIKSLSWNIYIFKQMFVVVCVLRLNITSSDFFNYIVTDHIVDRRSTKFLILHLESNPDSMKPA